MFKTRKKSMATLSAVAAAGIISLGGIAYAVFTENSNATAAGASADMQPLVVGQGKDAPTVVYASGESKLWPNAGNSHIAKVKIKVTNPNEVGLQVAAGGISGSAVFDIDADQTQCGSYLKLTSVISLAGDPVTVGPKATQELTVTGVYLDEAATNNCQNKPFTTHWTITGTAT